MTHLTLRQERRYRSARLSKPPTANHRGAREHDAYAEAAAVGVDRPADRGPGTDRRASREVPALPGSAAGPRVARRLRRSRRSTCSSTSRIPRTWRRPGRRAPARARWTCSASRIGHAQRVVHQPRSADSRALQEHPDRFFASRDVDPNRGMDAVRELEQAVEELGVKSATASSPPASPRRSRSTTRSSTRCTPSASSSTSRSACTRAYPGRACRWRAVRRA